MLTIVVSQLLEIQGVIHPYFLSKHQLERFLIDQFTSNQKDNLQFKHMKTISKKNLNI